MTTEWVFGAVGFLSGGLIVSVLGGFAFRWADGRVDWMTERMADRRVARVAAIEAEADTMPGPLLVRMRTNDLILILIWVSVLAIQTAAAAILLLLIVVAGELGVEWWVTLTLGAPTLVFILAIAVFTVLRFLRHLKALALTAERVRAAVAETEQEAVDEKA